MSDQMQDVKWDENISAKTSLFDFRLKEVWHYRDLISMFVWRDFVSVYKQTILGPIWHIIQPIFTTAVFTVVFSRIAAISTDGQPPVLFYLSGITIWTYFSGCLERTSNTFVANSTIFGKVYFPRMTVPISTVISGLISFGIQFGLFLVIYIFYWLNGADLALNYYIFLIPYLVILMAVLSLGLGIIVSSLTTKYRDLTFLIKFGIQLMMYATPIIYPLSSLSEKYQKLALLNPVAPIVELFRYSFFGTGVFSVGLILYSTAITAVFLLIGLVLFNKVEKSFMDTV